MSYKRFILFQKLNLHKAQKITLPNGEWGENCARCDGYVYPCKAVEAITQALK